MKGSEMIGDSATISRHHRRVHFPGTALIIGWMVLFGTPEDSGRALALIRQNSSYFAIDPPVREPMFWVRL